MTRGTIFGLNGTKMETRSSVMLIVTDRRKASERLTNHPDATVQAVEVQASGKVAFSSAVSAKDWTAAEMADMVYEVVRRWRQKQELPD